MISWSVLGQSRDTVQGFQILLFTAEEEERGTQTELHRTHSLCNKDVCRFWHRGRLACLFFCFCFLCHGSLLSVCRRSMRKFKYFVNKDLILFFFAHAKHSYHFITLGLNYWSHMDLLL